MGHREESVLAVVQTRICIARLIAVMQTDGRHVADSRVAISDSLRLLGHLSDPSVTDGTMHQGVLNVGGHWKAKG